MNSNNYANEMFQRFKNAFMAQDTDYLNVVFRFNERELYAEKFILSMASSTFESMLSSRWNPTNGPIEIESHSYEEIKELLTFIYSGECQLTNENICKMVDMAAFYQVIVLKDLCEEFLIKMEINIGNVTKFIEFVSKYPMMKLKKCVNDYLYENFGIFVESEEFINSTKTEIDNFLCFDFEVESQFDLNYSGLNKRLQPHQIYEAIRRWAEHQQINGNHCCIKEILPHYLQIKITNAIGQSISGVITNRLNNYSNELMLYLKNNDSDNLYNFILWKTEFKIQSTKNQLKKENEDHFYLACSADGTVVVRKATESFNRYFIMAKMFKNDENFEETPNCKFEFF